MWILMDTGFISIVQHNRDPRLMLVRSRVEDDLAALGTDCAAHGWDLDIERDDTADYRWRTIIPRDVLADILRDRVLGIDYDSHVKDVALERSAPNPARRDAYYDTWAAMHTMQTADDPDDDDRWYRIPTSKNPKRMR